MAVTTEIDERVRHIEALRLGLPKDRRLTVWTPGPPKKRSIYVQHPDNVAGLQIDCELYVGVGCVTADTEKKLGQFKRPSERHIVGLTGFAVDFDVIGSPDGKGGTKHAGAQSTDDAIRASRRIVEPTLLICSGYGIQAWWLFEEPLIFHSVEEREHAKRVMAQWQQKHRDLAGFHIDSTHDLNRLYRLAGTCNTKGAEPVSVHFLGDNEGKRYTYTELAELVHDVQVNVASTNGRSTAGVQLNGHIAPEGVQEIVAILHQDPDFAALWDRKPKPGDKSQSGYDFAIGELCHGLPNEEVVALIKAHRAQANPDDPKLNRTDYYMRFISKLRAEHPEPACDVISRSGDSGDQVRGVDAVQGSDDASDGEPDGGSELDLGDPEQPELDIPSGLLRWIDFAAHYVDNGVAWVCHELAARGALTIIAGEGGSGKSTLTMALAKGVLEGTDVAGITCMQGEVMIFDAEQGERIARRQINRLEVPTDGLHVCIAHGLDLGSTKHRLAISEAIREATPALVIFDSLRKLSPGAKENDSDDMAHRVDWLCQLAKRLDLAIILLHHRGKDSEIDWRGSSAINDQADLTFVLDWNPKRPDDARTLRCRKSRIADPPKPRSYRLQHDRFGQLGLIESAPPEDTKPRAAPTRESVKEQALAILRDGPGKRAEVARRLGRDQNDWTVREAFKELEKEGQISKSGDLWTGVFGADHTTPHGRGDE